MDLIEKWNPMKVLKKNDLFSKPYKSYLIDKIITNKIIIDIKATYGQS